MTIIVAPMTTKGRDYPTRAACRFQGKDGHVVLDQVRTVGKARLVKRLGQVKCVCAEAGVERFGGDVRGAECWVVVKIKVMR